MNHSQAEQNLQLLSIFYYIVGGIAALFSCVPVLQLVPAIMMTTFGFIPILADYPDGPPIAPFLPFSFFGIFLVLMILFVILLGWAFAVCMFIAGYSISKRRRHMFCMVMAGIACLFMPFGTILGVFSIILLSKPEIKSLFENTS